MRIMMNLSTFAMRHFVDAACKSAELLPMGGLAVDLVDGTTRKLQAHFKDNSDRLIKALKRANDQAWQTLEIALTGDSFWDRCKSFFATGDQKAFKAEMQKCLDALAFPDVPDPDRFRRFCASELRAAKKKAGLLSGDSFDPESLASQAGAFARYSDPSALIDAQQTLLDGMADELMNAGYEHLARLVAYQPRHEPLLIVAVRYFFRRTVEEDTKLFQGLAFGQLEQLQSDQATGFGLLRQALEQQQQQVQAALDKIQAELFATYNVASQIQDEQLRSSKRDEKFQKTVLDLLDEQKSKGGRHEEVYSAVLQLQGRLDMLQTQLRPRDSMSIRGDLERQLVKEVVSRYRALPESQRSQLPALLNAVGKLEVAAGDFQSAQKDFSRVAEIVSDAPARAEAHFNAYRASLERRDWAAALPEILAAAKLDPVHFAPFPMRKYRPVRILGAGGFGVAFLCHHERVQSQVVVKTLVADDLDRSLTDVFAEARVLRQLDHPGIIGLRDCDYADDAMTRPYLEMDYFESQSLEEHVQQHGVLTETAALDIARQIATALQATHRQNVLHRDVKPGNVLIRNDNGQWRAKLIDFGLALGTDRLLSSASSRTLRGSSIAGTIDYAAPEQLGKLPNLPVTPASDVFGFARTIYFAMFQTPHPKARHFEKLSKSLRTLLDDCSSDAPAERPQSFDDVLTRLGVKSAAPPASTGAKSGSDFWGATADFFRKTFGPVNSKPSATQKPVAAAEAPKPPPVPTTEPKLPAEVLEVLPIPQPTSEGIEIIDDLPMVQAIEEVQPVRSPNGTNRSK